MSTFFEFFITIEIEFIYITRRVKLNKNENHSRRTRSLFFTKKETSPLSVPLTNVDKDAK